MDANKVGGAVDICSLCGCVERAYIHVPHYGSGGHPLPDEMFCVRCWSQWRTVRRNLDGRHAPTQPMTCPHCQKIVAEDDATYTTVQPYLYTTLLNGQHLITLSTDTTVEQLKHLILTSQTVPFQRSDEFDLVVDERVINGVYVGVVTELQARRITKQIHLRIYPASYAIVLGIDDRSMVQTLKERHGLQSHVLFDACTGREFMDNQPFCIYEDIDTIAAMPRHLYDALSV
jgi:hypothetical protein